MQTEMLNSLLTIKINLYVDNICCKDFVCLPDIFIKFNNSMYNNNNNTSSNDNEDEITELIELVGDSYDTPCIQLLD
jgi:hypothetical protein